MKFTLKKSLIGMAALSILTPVASHAVNDGLGRAAKDGRGSPCVSSGGADRALDAASCASASQEVTATTVAERESKKAADAEAAAAARAAKEEAMMAVEPGSALKPGDKGAYVSHGTAAPIRDGFGRACVKDGQWHPGMSTEECDPDLHNLYKSKKVQPAQTELAPRIVQKPPEAVRSAAPAAAATSAASGASAAAAVAAGAAGAAVASGAADDAEAIAPFVAPLGANDDDPADESKVEELAEDEEVTPDMMLSEADRTLAEEAAVAGVAAAAVMDDDDEEDIAALEEFDDEEVTPDMMLSEADRTLAESDEFVMLAAIDDDDDEYDDGPMNDDDDEDTTPDMMLSAADRKLDDDDVVLLAAIPDDDDDDDDRKADDGEDEETTPDMMMSDADRTLEGEEIPAGIATLTDTSPGEVPPPEKVVENKPIIDNKIPDFPITKYDAGQPSTTAATLPVTITVQDGLFDFDRADLKSELITKLDGVASMLREGKVDSVKIVGHADPIGGADYNQGLSMRRAEATKRYLVGKGIDASRIRTTGAGENDLVVAREDCNGKRKQDLIDCLQPNRRVVVEPVGPKTAQK